MTKGVIINFDILITRIKEYITDETELNKITEAYEFALLKHFGQKRMTGEDYIIHPLSVAYILTDIEADADTICAALLHDVIEDCNVPKDEVRSLFGDDVSNLVDGLTKINNLKYNSGGEVMMANHRKILVGLSEDVRVIIIKLADRLHNMRTLWIIPESKQKQKARENLDILIPIAHRLGMSNIKSELEDLSLRYLKPDIYFQIVEKLNKTKHERDHVVEEMKEIVGANLKEHGISYDIKGRAKSIFSIYQKLDKGRKFSDIYDLLALRVYVDSEQECYQALGIIHSKFKPIPKRFKDYIAMPKTNMYQSLHTTVFGVQGQLFEIQIRTYEMDRIAELGIASHWSYKEKGSKKAVMQNAMEQKLQFFRSIIDLKSAESDEEFVNSVKEDVFLDTIYVFTPKGDVIELPHGSTPIDFAYKVHSKVGDKTVGAIVNGNIVPLNYELQDNDIIKINTSAASNGPSKEWINIAKTNQAKNKIKSFFSKATRDTHLQLGEELLYKELRNRKIAYNEFLTEDNKNEIMSEFKEQNFDDVYIHLSQGKYPVSAVVNVILKETDTKEEMILRKASENAVIKKPNLKNDIIVSGMEDFKVNIASCCLPIFGDDIVGYITKGYGITVHRMICPNVKDLEERIIDVSWNPSIKKKLPTEISIETIDTKNILLEVIAKTSNRNINVVGVTTRESSGSLTLKIIVESENKETLSKFMNDLRDIQNIKTVERVIK